MIWNIILAYIILSYPVFIFLMIKRLRPQYEKYKSISYITGLVGWFKTRTKLEKINIAILISLPILVTVPFVLPFILKKGNDEN